MQALTDPTQGKEVANPYTRLLVAAASEDRRLRIVYFSWRTFLSAPFDVLHVHWPEVFVAGSSALERAVKSLLLMLFSLRIRLQRKAVVRTVHNVQPHESVPALGRCALKMLDDLTTWQIVLNEATPRQANSPSTVVPHGHYRDAYVEPSAASIVPGRLLAFGQIRPYKGMEDLVVAFHDLPSTMSLVIAGKPDSPNTAEQLTELAAGANNIRLDLRFVPDDALAREIDHAELIVLPYRTVHNSGVALLALSLNRPILVRRSEATSLLQEEFGSHWVQLFEGELDASKLSAALHAARMADRPSRVDMSSRDWELLGRRTAEVYIQALQRRRSQVGH